MMGIQPDQDNAQSFDKQTRHLVLSAGELAHAAAAAAAAVDPKDADEAVAAVQLEDSDAERMLDGLLWEFTITKEAREEWAALPPVYKCAARLLRVLPVHSYVFEQVVQDIIV